MSVENLKDMNKYTVDEKRRGRNLLVVEGRHEKDKLFWLIFRCFPEIHVDLNDIWIYGTNIYKLYEDIAREYGSEWADKGEDIDLPLVISKKQHSETRFYKNEFVNIILIFDYERHDTNFSEIKILKMQEYFNDAADMGKLYINYPMIESYWHLKTIPDDEYAERKIPISLQPGGKYKDLVHRESAIGNTFDLPYRIDNLLSRYFETADLQVRLRLRDAILSISDEKNIDNSLDEILQSWRADCKCDILKKQLKVWLGKAEHVKCRQTFWEYMRGILQEIISHNICKANRVQNGQYQTEPGKDRKCFDGLDLTEILKIQNAASRDMSTGYIWVLNTCVFFVPEYNFALVSK